MTRRASTLPDSLPILIALVLFLAAAAHASVPAAAHRVVFGDGRHFDVVDVRMEEGMAFLTLEGGHVVGVASDRIARIEPVEPSGPGDRSGTVVEHEKTGPEARRGADSTSPTDPDRSADRRGSRAAARGSEDIESIILEAAARYAIEADLLAAVIAVESGFNAHAVSPKGAQGLMQLMPGTARELAVTDPFDPRQNIFAGARYLKQLLDDNGNQYWRALAAYNAGAGRVARYDGIPPYRETIDYIRKVIDIYASAATRGGSR